MKSHNDEQTHDENLALDWIKSDPNYFFKYAKKFSMTGTEVGPLQDSHGDLVNDKKLMSDLLLNQFLTFDMFSYIYSAARPSRSVHR